MKTSQILLVALSAVMTGCLVPGAPHDFNYSIAAPNPYATLRATSYPSDIEYRYVTRDRNIDSVFVLEPKLQAFKLMEKTPNSNEYRLRKKEALINGNLKRLKKVTAIVIRKHWRHTLDYDTLFVIR